MTVEGLIAALHELGYKINNLWELDDGTWRCAVRGADPPNCLMVGKTPTEALANVCNSLNAPKKPTFEAYKLDDPLPKTVLDAVASVIVESDGGAFD